MRGFPYEEFPTGWYQVAWCDELAPGDVRPLRYFAQELVVFRDERGEIAVLDAKCPHLGAHLGHGGHVEGCDIVCPFHGWRFDGEGRNTLIPFADRPNRLQRIPVWHVREVNGAVVVWYDSLGRDPLWELPELDEVVDGTMATASQLRRLHERVRLHPQFVVENLVDAAHQHFVHSGSEPTTITGFDADGPIFKVFNDVLLGAKQETTWLTPSGAYTGEINSQAWGMGFAIGRFEKQDGVIHHQAITPIDEEWCDLRFTLFVDRTSIDLLDDPTSLVNKRFRFLVRQLEADFPIWENMVYVPRAPFSPFEAKPYRAFRRWAQQFYPSAEGDSPDPS